MQLTPATTEAVDDLAPTGTLRAAIDPSNFLLVTGEDGDPTPVGRSSRAFAMCSVHSL